jgi:hypothetical protein
MAPWKLPLVFFHEIFPNPGLEPYDEDLKQTYHLSQLVLKEEQDKSNPRIKRVHLCRIRIWSRSASNQIFTKGKRTWTQSRGLHLHFRVPSRLPLHFCIPKPL